MAPADRSDAPLSGDALKTLAALEVFHGQESSLGSQR